MSRRTRLLLPTLLCAGLGCAEKPAPAESAAALVPAVLPASAALGAPAPFTAPPDALLLMPAAEFTQFKTTAGTLHCAPDLCRTTRESRADEDGGPVWSTHLVKLTPDSQSVEMKATDGLSDDPSYLLEGRDIAGEAAYAPGDGCLYFHQSANAYFPVTKRYCVGSTGKLERKPPDQNTYPLDHTARFKLTLRLVETPENKKPLAIVPADQLMFVTAARVDQTHDWQDSISWLRVRTQQGQVGWVPMPESVPQCEDETKNQTRVCFNGD